jgi:hypothetical protein
MILFFIKFIIALLGLLLTFIYLIIGLIKRNKTRYKIAGRIFLTTWITILVITLVEFILHDKGKDYRDKETILVAMREAALGSIHLKVYVDSTYDLGNESNVTLSGRICVRKDTVFLLNKKDSVVKSFLIEENVLTEIKNSGIRFLQIYSNELLRIDSIDRKTGLKNDNHMFVVTTSSR